MQLDETLEGQELQCFPDRRARHPECLREGRLAEARPRVQLAVDDKPSDAAPRFLVERGARRGWRNSGQAGARRSASGSLHTVHDGSSQSRLLPSAAGNRQGHRVVDICACKMQKMILRTYWPCAKLAFGPRPSDLKSKHLVPGARCGADRRRTIPRRGAVDEEP